MIRWLASVAVAAAAAGAAAALVLSAAVDALTSAGGTWWIWLTLTVASGTVGYGVGRWARRDPLATARPVRHVEELRGEPLTRQEWNEFRSALDNLEGRQ